MNMRLSAPRPGVAWVVYSVTLVPALDRDGNQRYELWNPRAPLRARQLTVVGLIYADNKDEALRLAHAYHPNLTLEVQSRASAEIEGLDQSIRQRSRKPPRVSAVKRFRHAQAVRQSQKDPA